MYENFPKHEAERINKYTLWLLCDNAKIHQGMLLVWKMKWKRNDECVHVWVTVEMWFMYCGCSLWYSPPRLFDIFFFALSDDSDMKENSCRRVFTFSICHTANAEYGRPVRVLMCTRWMKKKWKTHGSHWARAPRHRATLALDRVNRETRSLSLSKYDTVYVESHSFFFFSFRTFGFSENILHCDCD